MHITFGYIRYWMVIDEIPDDYDLRKIVHALLKELAKGSPTRVSEYDVSRIIQAGEPKD